MSDVRPALSGEQLRETKERLVSAVVEQQKRGGVGEEVPADPLGDVKAAEEFLLPILRRVEVNHEEDRRKDLVRAPEIERQQDAIDFSHRRQVEKLKPGERLVERNLGEYDWDLASNKVKPVGNSWRPPNPKEGPAIKATRARFRMLAQIPEWKQRIHAVYFANKPQRWKDQQFKKILKDSVRLYGDPRTMDVT